MEGDRNIGESGVGFYIVIFRLIVDWKLKVVYGEGLEVICVDGLGLGLGLIDLFEGICLVM